MEARDTYFGEIVTAQLANSARAARRGQILQAARATIEECGPGALTGQIAERAGLARPNVYRHFSSKEDLDLAVARSAYQELRAAIRTGINLSGTPVEVVGAPIAAQVAWADAHPNLYRFLVSRGHQHSIKRNRGERGDFAAELAAAGALYFPHFADDPVAAEATLVAVIGLVDASVLRWLDRRVDTRERLTERLTAHAWQLINHHLHQQGVHIDPAVPLRNATGGELSAADLRALENGDTERFEA